MSTVRKLTLVKNQNTASVNRMAVTVPTDTFVKLEKLKESLEADSFAEVIRRALRFHERLIIEYGIEIVLPKEPGASGSSDNNGSSKRITLALKDDVYERMKRLMETTNAPTLAATIRRALSAYAQFVAKALAKKEQLSMKKSLA